jgi:hypothetical protein
MNAPDDICRDQVATPLARHSCVSLGLLGTSFLFVLLILPARLALASGQNPLERRLFEEAPQAWEAYERFWLILQGTSSAIDRELAGNTKPTRMRFLRKQCNGFNLVQMDVWEPNNYSAKVFGDNLQYHFELTRDEATKPWVISELKRKSQGDPTYPVTTEGLTLGPGNTQLPTLIKSSHFKLLELVPARENGEDLVRMTFTYTPEEKNPLRGGWAVLDPQHDWVVRRAGVTRGGDGKQFESTIQYDYKEGSNHHPILTRVHLEQATKEKDRLTPTREVVTDLDLQEQELVPQKEFMLSAFGLPEPPGEERATRWYLWLGGVGLGCLILGAIVARLRRRASGVAGL